MMIKNLSVLQTLRITYLLTLSTILIGCSAGSQTAKAVDAELATNTLSRVLDHWKAGGTTEDFRIQTPEIVVQDFDWKHGQKLRGYSVLGAAEAIDANLHINVKLTLGAQSGTSEVKEVTYIVGTDPVLTVFRKAF